MTVKISHVQVQETAIRHREATTLGLGLWNVVGEHGVHFQFTKLRPGRCDLQFSRLFNLLSGDGDLRFWKDWTRPAWLIVKRFDGEENMLVGVD